MVRVYKFIDSSESIIYIEKLKIYVKEYPHIQLTINRLENQTLISLTNKLEFIKTPTKLIRLKIIYKKS